MPHQRRTPPDTRTIHRGAAAPGPSGARGYSYQARVAAAVAVSMLRRTPLSWIDRGLTATPEHVKLETGSGGDDLRIELSDGKAIEIECRSAARPSKALDEALRRLLACACSERTACAVLVVDPKRSARSAHTDLRIDLDRLRSGRDDGLRPLARSLLALAKEVGDSVAIARVHVVAKDLDAESDGEMLTARDLGDVLVAPGGSALAAWSILCDYAQRRLGEASAFRLDDVQRALADAGFTLRRTDTGVLGRLRGLSAIALADMSSLGEVVQGESVRLSEVYVPRRVEGTVLAELSAETSCGRPVVVVGDAGVGKTSLIWSICQTLGRNERHEVIALKAGLLRGARGVAVERAELLSATEECRRVGRTLFLLIDTLDLLLNSEEERDSTIEVLDQLADAGCRVFCTSRPQQARFLQPLAPRTFRLDRYDDTDEIEAAVKSHVRRFYRAEGREGGIDQVARVLRAVSRGRPLREVCLQPLTLRMLFVLYAPEEIPEEIHVFRLYNKFWVDRVSSDRRAGTASSNAADCSEAAGALALAMLREGAPEVSTDLARHACAVRGIALDSIETLVARGVLHRSEDGRVAFFHQTFFEHAAARGLLRCGHEEAVRVLRDRLLATPGDLFAAPVAEHALVLAEEFGAAARTADSAVCAFVAASQASLALSALYVFAHRRTVGQELAAVLGTLLAEGDETLIDSFAAVAANIDQARDAQTFDLLRSIWKLSKPGPSERVLEVAGRLAGRAPDSVIDFIDEADPVARLSGKRMPLARALVPLLAVLAESRPNWTWRKLVEVHARRPSGRSGYPQLYALQLLLRCRAAFGGNDVASRFWAALPEHDVAVVTSEQAELWGELWHLDWRDQGVGAEAALRQARSAGATLDPGRLAGLGHLMAASSPEDVEPMWSAFVADHRSDPRNAWGNSVWRRLLSGVGVSGAVRDAVVAHVRSDLRSALDSGDPLPEHLVRALNGLRFADVPSEAVLRMFAHPALAEPAAWTPSGLAGMIVPAALAGHEGARRALDSRTHAPLVRRAILRLAEAPAFDAAPATVLLDVLIARKATTELASVVREVGNKLRPALELRTATLQQFVRAALGSASGTERRMSIEIWLLLVVQRLAAPPTAEELRAAYSRESDVSARLRLIRLAGAMSLDGGTPAKEAVVFLQECAQEGRAEERDEAILKLVDVAGAATSSDAPLRTEVVHLVLSGEASPHRVSMLGYVLVRMVEADPHVAVDAIARILTSPCVEKLGQEPKRKIAARWRTPLRAVFRSASCADRLRLVGLARSVGEILGRALVEAAGAACFDDVRGELEQFLSDSSVPMRLRRHVHRQLRGDPAPGDRPPWPELDRLIGWR